MSDPRPKLVGPKFVANQWKENPSTAGALTAFAGFGFMAFVVAIGIAAPGLAIKDRLIAIGLGLGVGGGLIVFGIKYGRRNR